MLHLLQLVLFALAGVSLLVLLNRETGVAGRRAHVAIGPFVVYSRLPSGGHP